MHWRDEADHGFVARCGDQFVEMCCFELADDDLDKVFSVSEKFGCEHYDWGN